MPARIVAVGESDWSVEAAKGDTRMLLQVTLSHEPAQDGPDGTGMSVAIRVKNHLTTAMQLTLIEAVIQQLNEVKQGLVREVTKGNRS